MATVLLECQEGKKFKDSFIQGLEKTGFTVIIIDDELTVTDSKTNISSLFTKETIKELRESGIKVTLPARSIAKD